MSEKLQVGIVGVGMIGATHARVLQGEETAEVAALADLRLEKAKKLGQEISARPYERSEEMFEEEDLDLIVVATPDPAHKGPFLGAVESGAETVICEKPLATNLEDAVEMMRAARDKGVGVFVNFENRFTTMSMSTKYVLRQGGLGAPVYGEVKLDDNISVPTGLWGERSSEWASGSSPAHFLLSHVCDLLRWYLEPAEVEAVQAISQREVLGNTPDLYDAFLIWDNGVKTRIKAEWIKHTDNLVEFYTHLEGDKGSIFSHRHPEYGARVGWSANLDNGLPFDQVREMQEEINSCFEGVNQIGAPPNESLSSEFRVTAQRKPDATRGGGNIRGGLEVKGDKRLHGDRFFLSWLIEGSPEGEGKPRWEFGGLPTGEDGLRAVEIVEALVDSAESGRREEVKRTEL